MCLQSGLDVLYTNAADYDTLQSAIDNTPEFGKLLIPSTHVYEVDAQLLISKSIHIIGDNTILRTVTGGLDGTFKATGVDIVRVEGFIFDQNNLGRGCIVTVNCKNTFVYGCKFTGYSAETEYYQVDSAILVDNFVEQAERVIIENCILLTLLINIPHNEYLVRSITVQARCRYFTVTQSLFR